MSGPVLKKFMFILLILLGLTLGVAACTSTGTQLKSKPVSQMTPAEQEEQDPTFWPMWGHMHGLGN
jgi:hypothetical protein